MSAPADHTSRQRLDVWLWHARFLRTRTKAQRQCLEIGVRVSGRPTSRPAHPVRPGDILTFVVENQVMTLRILKLSQRRLPADEACTLYEHLSPTYDPD